MEEPADLTEAERRQLRRLGFEPKEVWVKKENHARARASTLDSAREIIARFGGTSRSAHE
ncbi:hypothetical protein [Aureimonas leprariae]|uniref:Uncharacterized protein n=1 Tax=Plantimonas leprariae TaxID=2615207 RepID=A0A7V7TY21_9HYPH|nr:hypothetical protein [Aureimonas leprariae]KAB0676540.1 hypothetical protein F6X38_20860 [Aureimonas leprariae]